MRSGKLLRSLPERSRWKLSHCALLLITSAALFFRTHRWSCVELSHRARHRIRTAVSLGRAHLVVIRGVRLQIVHAHPKDHVAVSWVDSGGRHCRQVKVIRIFAVVHDGVVQDRASRIVCSPTDEGKRVGNGFDGRADVDLGRARTLTRACQSVVARTICPWP